MDKGTKHANQPLEALPPPYPTTTRNEAKDGLFLALYGPLCSKVYDLEPGLAPGDSDLVLQGVAESLPSYRGKLTEQAFTRWATGKIEQAAHNLAAHRWELTQNILKANRRVIDGAVYTNMSCFAKDCAVDLEDVRAEIAVLILRYAKSLSSMGTANVRTRLRALIHRHCLDYHIKKRNRRLEIVTKYQTTLRRNGVEFLSDAELASMRYDEGEPDYCPARVAA